LKNSPEFWFFLRKKVLLVQISSKISIVLIRTISQYLESHKRLVVPQLGTFIVKEPGVSIVFSELLKRDDGTLRRLLIDGGLSELEAAGEIDRFVFEVRHAVEHGAEFRLDGFVMPYRHSAVSVSRAWPAARTAAGRNSPHRNRPPG